MPKFEKGNNANPRGRPKGAANKTTTAIKEMIEQALSEVGGVEYLKIQAAENPSAFMGLVGKILPKDVHLEGEVAARIFTVRDMTRPRRQEGEGGNGGS